MSVHVCYVHCVRLAEKSERHKICQFSDLFITTELKLPKLMSTSHTNVHVCACGDTVPYG